MKNVKLHIGNSVGMALKLSSHLRCILTLSFIIYHFSFSVAQIVIGGSVYGGGNAGDTGGKTTVNVYAGDIHAVFAGARMANVGGSAFVHIDGEHASNYILADYVYGGNDIAGTIGTSSTVPVKTETSDGLTEVGTGAGQNNIDNEWNAFVRISTKTDNSGEETDDAQKVYIGQLFGGGNGYYKYEEKTTGTGTIVKDMVTDETIVSSTTTLSSPELGKTYLEILGGSIVYAYGGGNDATVTDKTIICLDNPSKVVGSIIDATNPNAGTGGELLNDARFEKMRINTMFSYPSSDAYQIGRLFGGNNKADMAIRPRWNLKRGKVRMLYGGGNEGRMTSPEGLLLQVDGEGMVVDNVYGGCRKADVQALYSNGTPIPYEDIQLDPNDNPNNIPGGYAARVRILAGDVNNVYGGNDISGNIYGGCTVGILTSVHGDVYGGGNGSYAYTDNAKLKDDPKYSDFYYNPKEILNLDGNSFTGLQSAEALNIFRPNAERVSILVRGTATKPTIVEGALYVGGNSASLRSQSSSSSSGNNMTHVKVGSYVIIDNVFLGNNGENMVKYDEADTEGRGEGVLRTLASTQKDPDGNNAKFSQMDLTKTEQFNKYMEGCAMKVNPTVVFESKANGDKVDYIPYSTKFGSLFCGGNVGSIIVPGKIKVDFNDKIIIYDKVVGGCNNANVYQTAYNAEYLGGIMGAATAAPEGAIGDKLELNFGGLKIQPMRWKIQRDENYEPVLDENGKEQYVRDANGNRILEWNTVDSRTFDTATKKYKPMAPVEATPTNENGEVEGTVVPFNSSKDLYRRFQGGNIYGGCYERGHVNGNVIINLNASLVDRKGENAIFDQVEENEGEAKLYDGNYNITQRYTGVLLGEQGMDPLGRALNVFGGGYGGDSEIWGSATINLNAGYTFQIFGGGEQGPIGQAVDHNPNATDPSIHDLAYVYNENYSTYINLKGSQEGVYRGYVDNDPAKSDNEDMAEAEFIYGGSFEGLIAGDTHINLGNGRIFNSFAGSCNADILGHTETYVGRQANDDGTYTDGGGFPWIRDHIYGGNDLGGRILNTKNFMDRVSSDIRSQVYNPKGKTVSNTDSSPAPDVVNASAYTEYIQGRVEDIFGGCYGDYDYRDDHYKAYAYTNSSTDKTDTNLGTMRDGYYKPWMCNAFVNFKPNNHARNAVAKIYGAGQGHAYAHQSDYDRDGMQDRSYVLIDILQTITKYQGMEVFGAGDYSGVGMRNTTGIQYVHDLTPAIAQTNDDGVTASTVIDLVRGQIYAAYGGSYKEGFTRRTILNVPTGSTIQFKRIFGGAYGLKNEVICDVYDANINYSSGDAVAEGDQTVEADFRKNQTTGEMEFMSGAVFGGNNSFGRTLYSKINVESAVVQDKATGYSSRVFGGGYGSGSWSQYTEINLKNGASVYEVYGGGYGGRVYNKETVFAWQAELDKNNAEGAPSNLPLDLGKGYEDEGLDCYLVKENPLGTKTNTNVYINKGATVWGYCYGGGLGADATVSGTTYIGLHGGRVNKDLYAGGWGGGVFDEYKVAKDNDNTNDFIATTNAYIEGGTVRNVYGGGYQGSVGYHDSSTTATTDDILGETNVVIGIRKDQVFPDNFVYDGDSLNYYKGVPAIQRNAYGAGEGGAVYGTANVTLNNGYIGYYYDGVKNKNNISYEAYVPKLDDESWAVVEERANRLKDCGNVFGAGYDDKSSCDFTNITMWGGTVRGCIYGGGEIATVGRAKTTILSGIDRGLEAIYKYGKTQIELFNGHVKRNVFGGGKGYNILGYGGTNELYTDGYVFGQTEVHIHGGEVGTVDGVADGYGNVFGGGDVGFVYGNGYFDERSNLEGTTSPNHKYYYGAYQCKADYGSHKEGDVIAASTYNDMSADEKSHWQSGKFLTEDCKVVVSPYLQVKETVTDSIEFEGKKYGPYDYIPTDFLNTLSGKDPDTKLYGGNWTKLYTGAKLANGDTDPNDPVERGIIIRNAVFAGGNVSSNSDKTYANATTVFGNTTATLYDAYHRDFITVGTEHTGGLYGGGNLSIVGGYRELNITNYGTDYYGQNEQITLEEYRKLSNRERAYFQLKYQCKTKCYDKNNKEYNPGDKLSEEDYNELFGSTNYYNDNYWEQYGFCSIYAGRLLNTIQRADFCGVYGSRMVLQGAKDRVADVGDNTVYTINRVGEVSLNQQHSVIAEDLALKQGKTRATNVGDQDADDYVDYEKAIHGNYFGIYSVVNYLGNLTSDVHFDDQYRVWDKTTEKGKDYPESSTTYENWKTNHMDKPNERNKGVSFNQVALASGVFLELTTENSTKTKKDYGYITGIVELDLINVKKDIEGGGYVYARNQHGKRTEDPNYPNAVLSEYNKAKIVNNVEYRDDARTYKRYTYSTVVSEIEDYQTSGNFIHKKKRIVDDCYPNNGVYKDGYVKSPAHYWYIKGDVYIYDQLISAYAGSATAYHKEVKIPLTITAGSNGKLKLLNVQPNLYAYYGDKDQTTKIPAEGVKLDDESATYHLNDVITWWDWNQLSPGEQKYFVKETYVNVDTCTVDGNKYAEGAFVMLPTDSTTFKTNYIAENLVLDKKGNPVTKFSELFHPSNNISHDTGYVLTFDMDSPSDWDDWYSPISGSSTYSVDSDGQPVTNRKKKEEYNPATDSENYRVGPTFALKADETIKAGLYGQRDYTVGEIISKEVYKDYETTTSGKDKTGWPTQAEVDTAFVAISDCQVGNVFVQEGHAIPKETYNDLSPELKAKFDSALVCVNSLRVGEEEYILRGELVGKATLDDLATKYMNYNNSLTNIDDIDQPTALKEVKEHLSEAYCVTEDGKYGGQYFEKETNYSALKAWCSLPNDRTKFKFNQDAFDVLSDPTFAGDPLVYAQPYCDEKPVDYTAYYSGDLNYTYKDKDGNSHTISTDAQRTLTREDFEKVMNEQQYFTRLSVPGGGETTFYIVKENFYDGGTPYAKGQDISSTEYGNLSAANKAKVDNNVKINNSSNTAMTVYYCYESGGPKQVGDTIHVDTYGKLNNYQKAFTVQGAEPTETTTLYVAQESSAKDVTSEKVITVVYQYTYYEDDEGDNEDGTTSTEDGICLKNELHVVNIHLKLESGVPEIGPLSTPPTILPGKKFGMKAPSVNPGLYEIISNGWEIYYDDTDAELHRNGMPFTNNNTPVYWYQNQKVFLAFYSKTYLGKTYSNYVPLTVANYHDLDAVMKDKEHHLYVDHPDVERNSKIYIDNRECESDATKSELDLLKDFFDLSVSGLTGHASLDSHVRGGADLEFFLNSDVSPKAYTTWTPIGNSTQCFEGTLHGDGYTISGLDHSLFGKLCGNVYNLGVTGSFTSAGVADEGGGYVENCWVKSSATSGFSGNVNAVFDKPDNDGFTHVVNCYYPVAPLVKQDPGNSASPLVDLTPYYKAGGPAIQMDSTAFYNGTVAYNLNGFYLNKRYYDGIAQASGKEYHYYQEGTDGNMIDKTAYYPSSHAATIGDLGYVEGRYKDGDFVYAGGTIPEAYDERMRVVVDGTTSIITYAPIWPDDYIYFGQMLTYGHSAAQAHQDWPSRINKSDNRLLVSDASNRVYRAPAYYRSAEMGVAHYNLNAYLAAKSAPKTVTDQNLKDAYSNMTAIDFAGHNDNTWALGFKTEGFAAGSPAFYPPLLDDDGLLNIVNEGETPNLLVYVPSAEANVKTYNVLNEYFIGTESNPAEPVYSDFTESSGKYYDGKSYGRVAIASTGSIHGHLVQSGLTTATDHLLVDKQDFYCPIAYQMGDDYHMWYQRKPEKFVSTAWTNDETPKRTTTGWEDISLPFTAELVTTQDKGEITHFYDGSATSKNDTKTKIGHEYWLRDYQGKLSEENGIMTAKLNYPATGETMDKTVSNMFLWDYYYDGAHDQQDANADTYPTDYYAASRSYSDYSMLSYNTPYLIGFPSDTFYEFDLSGTFEATTTATPQPEKLDPQTVTFVSEEGAVIACSDELPEWATAKDGYLFKTNYLKKEVPANGGYMLNAAGNSYDKVTAATVAVPFRPYFVPSGNAAKRRVAEKIVFDMLEIAMDDEEENNPMDDNEGRLIIGGKKQTIIVTSSLSKAVPVRIVNTSGLTINTFTIQPGETIETPVPMAGVYIIRAAGGKYIKKVVVK